MSKSLLFWILMLLWAIGLVRGYVGEPKLEWTVVAGGVVLFVIVGLLGSSTFGKPLKE